MDEFKIPTAAVPPTEPATPPDLRAVDARVREVRRQALEVAVRYAAACPDMTVAGFWSNVDIFAQYIASGVHP